ncbi:hypothetical protein CEXT_196841 [Caerostris extrusa]|uniref:Uncharacterized protein n=1 Tax=Caerostris extrusa TaxID=172846 RepID=A0AAV4Y9S8_CAEEX|nr:hypothetical protein CEXT_196841 [Caerostris extrusa]
MQTWRKYPQITTSHLCAAVIPSDICSAIIPKLAAITVNNLRNGLHSMVRATHHTSAVNCVKPHGSRKRKTNNKTCVYTRRPVLEHVETCLPEKPEAEFTLVRPSFWIIDFAFALLGTAEY